MKHLRLPLVVLFLCFSMFLSSCIKDSDLNTEETLASVPMLESELLTMSLGATDFIEAGKLHTPQMVTDTMSMASVRSDFFVDEIKKTTLSLKFLNSFDADFNVDLEFFNDFNELKYTVHIPLASGSIEKPMNVETTVSIKEPELRIFQEATKIVYRIAPRLDSTTLSSNTEGSISCHSKVSFIYDL